MATQSLALTKGEVYDLRDDLPDGVADDTIYTIQVLGNSSLFLHEAVDEPTEAEIPAAAAFVIQPREFVSIKFVSGSEIYVWSPNGDNRIVVAEGV